jgi:hypothetical protein
MRVGDSRRFRVPRQKTRSGGVIVYSKLRPFCVRNWFREVRGMARERFEANCFTHDCSQTVFLPRSTSLQVFESRPYSGADTWPLLFLCPQCRRRSDFQPQDFHPEIRPERWREPGEDALWFVEVECSATHCGLRVLIHTIAPADANVGGVTLKIAQALRQFECTNGHALGDNFPGDAKFVSWE